MWYPTAADGCNSLWVTLASPHWTHAGTGGVFLPLDQDSSIHCLHFLFEEVLGAVPLPHAACPAERHSKTAGSSMSHGHFRAVQARIMLPRVLYVCS